jgi:hypothetical protein
MGGQITLPQLQKTQQSPFLGRKATLQAGQVHSTCPPAGDISVFVSRPQ